MCACTCCRLCWCRPLLSELKFQTKQAAVPATHCFKGLRILLSMHHAEYLICSAVCAVCAVNFLTKGSLNSSGPDASIVLELLPVMPTIAREVLPQITSMLISRISARAVRELYA